MNACIVNVAGENLGHGETSLQFQWLLKDAEKYVNRSVVQFYHQGAYYVHLRLFDVDLHLNMEQKLTQLWLKCGNMSQIQNAWETLLKQITALNIVWCI